MTVTAGTKAVNDGLLFQYDMYNLKKSFKGAPTTNQHSNTDTLSGWAFSSTSYVDGVLLTNTSTNPHFVLQNTPVTVGLNYTQAAEVKYNGGYRYFEIAPSTGFASSYAIFDLLTGTITGSVAANATMTLLDDGYYKCALTQAATGTTSAGRMAISITSGSTGRLNSFLGDGTGFLFRKPQFEQSSFATPFVENTRASTDIIKDLRGNRITTATELVHNPDNTFSFNGSTSAITIPSLDFPTEQTIQLWLKPTESDSVRRNPYNQAYGGYGTLTHEISGIISYYYGNGRGNAAPYTAHASPFTIIQNELACICITRNTTETVWYKNGEQVGTARANPYGVLNTHISTITIGTGYAGSYLGGIYAVRLYDRALTPAEVLQNYQATSSRYTN